MDAFALCDRSYIRLMVQSGTSQVGCEELTGSEAQVNDFLEVLTSNSSIDDPAGGGKPCHSRFAAR